MRFRDKVVIVTGGGTGIGAETALHFASEGAKVLITGRRIEKLKELSAEAQDHNLDVDYLVGDVSEEGSCIEVVEETIRKNGKIDILFNNAGVILPGITHETDVESFQKVFDINVKGTFMMSKYTIPHMIKNGGGCIVNNSSVVGTKGFVGISAYVASKGAVNQLTKSMALEYAGNGIRVNAVCPGAVWTPMVSSYIERSEDSKAAEDFLTSFHPVGRMAKTHEIALVVLFLCDDNVKFMTGTLLSVDGGWIAK